MINHYFHPGLFPQIKSSVHFCDDGNLLVLSGQNMEEVREGKYRYSTSLGTTTDFIGSANIEVCHYYSLLVDKLGVELQSLQQEAWNENTVLAKQKKQKI